MELTCVPKSPCDIPKNITVAMAFIFSWKCCCSCTSSDSCSDIHKTGRRKNDVIKLNGICVLIYTKQMKENNSALGIYVDLKKYLEPKDIHIKHKDYLIPIFLLTLNMVLNLQKNKLASAESWRYCGTNV